MNIQISKLLSVHCAVPYRIEIRVEITSAMPGSGDWKIKTKGRTRSRNIAPSPGYPEVPSDDDTPDEREVSRRVGEERLDVRRGLNAILVDPHPSFLEEFEIVLVPHVGVDDKKAVPTLCPGKHLRDRAGFQDVVVA